MKKFNYLIIFLFACTAAFSQGDYYGFFIKSRKINNTGLIMLGGWSYANMMIGAGGWAETSEGSTQYFKKMNFVWNSVNLGIVGYGLISSRMLKPRRMSSQQLINTHIQYKHIYLISAGLDLGFIGGGLLMKHYAPESNNRSEMLSGFGNSMLLQGSFLFAFDAVMYLIQQTRQYLFLGNMDLSVMKDGLAIRYAYNF